MPASSKPPDLNRTFEVVVDETSYEIELTDGDLTVNDEPVPYRFSKLSEHTYVLILDKRSYSIVIQRNPQNGKIRTSIAGESTDAVVKDEKDLLLESFGLEADTLAAGREVRSPMPGLVLSVKVAVGDEVKAGEGLLVLEAMKMENELKAPASGVVSEVHAAEGNAVDKDELLVELE